MKRRLKYPLLPTLLIVTALVAAPASAEPVYHPSGPKLTFGGATHRQMNVSDMGNPAYPATLPPAEDGSASHSAGFSIGLGIEYNGNDNFFKLLDALGNDDSLAPGDSPPADGELPDDGEDGINIQDIIASAIGDLTPEQQQQLDELIKQVSTEAIRLTGLLAISMSGLNAKAFVTADVPILISSDALGGAWTFAANRSLTTNLIGLNDPIEFDADTALAELEKIRDLNATDPVTTFTLGSNAYLVVDPATGDTAFQFTNDSAVLTRAAAITEISIGYSRKVWQKKSNTLYIGIEPKFYDVGLSNTAVPIADVEDAKSIFDALDSSSFKHTSGLGIDIGAIWSGKQYQFGATVTNLNEPDFQFPAADLSSFSNPDIIAAIRERETYVMKRQLKLEGGFVTPGGAWGLNFGLDANAVPDPMRDDYQWASVGANFASDSWWLPGARLGARKNLAGTKLTYLTGGVTVFNILNLDLATTTETINVDGKTLPRGLIGNISMQLVF